MGLHLKGVNLSKRFDTQCALEPIHFEIQADEWVGVVGPSGSGKSTLLQLMGLLDKPSSGRFLINQKDTDGLTFAELSQLRNQKIGFMFQFFHLVKGWSALDNICLPLLYRSESYESARDAAYALLKRLDLEHLAKRPVHQLSGGEKQRMALMRALITEPDLVLLDEPTASLDSENAKQLMMLLEESYQKRPFTLVLVSHDPSIRMYTDRCITLNHETVLLS